MHAESGFQVPPLPPGMKVTPRAEERIARALERIADALEGGRVAVANDKTPQSPSPFAGGVYKSGAA
jgi:hypothetical protein